MRPSARSLLPLLLWLPLAPACGSNPGPTDGGPLPAEEDAGSGLDTFIADDPYGLSGYKSSAEVEVPFFSYPAGGTFECSLDGATYAACTSPQRYTALAEGSHTLQVRAVLDGVRDLSPASRTWTVDTLAPATTLVEAPSGTLSRRTANFAFLSTEAGGFQCSLDGAAFVTCTSPFTYSELLDGDHVVAVRARDLALNVDPSPEQAFFAVDTHEPDTRITAGPAEGSTSGVRDASLAFESTEPGSHFECALDDAAFSGCASPQAYPQLTDGWHVFEVRAIDAVGNTDLIPAQRRWLVDTGSPQARITSGPSGVTNSLGGYFEFDANGAQATFECSLDSAPFTACTSPKSYPTPADREYRFQVRAVSATGVVGVAAVRTWTLDTTAPETLIGAGPAEGSTSTTRSASFGFTSSETNSTFECALDGTDYVACTSPKSYADLADGEHLFLVRARDALANTDATPAGRRWTVSAPTFTRMRVVAANITSGNNQSYDPGEGARILKGLQPDVVMIQEFNYTLGARSFVDSTFGTSFQFYREDNAANGTDTIPNGIISRWPILASGEWADSAVNDRDFAWARIDVPGPKDLWVVSVHLWSGGGASGRDTQARDLVARIQSQVPAGDYLVFGGDLNTGSRTEACVTTLSQVLVTTGPYPADQNGDEDTNNGATSRNKPYDWVLADADLDALSTEVVIGSITHPKKGLVFDSRVYSPLGDVSPVLVGDSGATNMQHMAVVKDFLIPSN